MINVLKFKVYAQRLKDLDGREYLEYCTEITIRTNVLTTVYTPVRLADNYRDIVNKTRLSLEESGFNYATGAVPFINSQRLQAQLTEHLQVSINKTKFNKQVEKFDSIIKKCI